MLPTTMTILLLLLLVFPLVFCYRNEAMEKTLESVNVTGKGNVPKVYVLGVQKGGSSSLYEFLIKHPLFCGGIHKEPHFFDWDESWKRGRNYYKALYTDPKCSSNKKARYIDATTMMHRMDKAAPRLAQFFSEDEKQKLKFIVLLREPVSRDYSWYEHLTRADLAAGLKFSEIKTYREIDEMNVLRNRHEHRSGKYLEQLMHFSDYFRRDQILVLNSDAIFQNSSKVMDIISKFLEIPKLPEWDGQFPHDAHLGYSRFQGVLDCIMAHTPSLDCEFRDILGKYYEPWNNDLDKWIEGSRQTAHPLEPAFTSFGDSYKKVACVPHAREQLQQLIVKEQPKSSCL